MPDEKAEVKRILSAKRKIKRDLMKLSFYEKIQRVILMQAMAAKLAKDKTNHYVWEP